MALIPPDCGSIPINMYTTVIGNSTHTHTIGLVDSIPIGIYTTRTYGLHTIGIVGSRPIGIILQDISNNMCIHVNPWNYVPPTSTVQLFPLTSRLIH